MTPYALQKNESLYFLHFHGYNTHTNYYAVTLHPMYKCISFQTCNQQSWLPHTVYKYLDSPTRRTDGVVPGLSLIVLQCYILLQLIAQYFHTSNVTGLLANVARNTAQTNPVLRVRRQRTSTGVLCVAMCCNVAQCCSVMVAIAAACCSVLRRDRCFAACYCVLQETQLQQTLHSASALNILQQVYCVLQSIAGCVAICYNVMHSV